MASAGRILIMPKGNYDSSATYEMLDMVHYNGTSWLAKKTVKGIEPSATNSEHWHKMFDMSALSSDYLPRTGGVITGSTKVERTFDDVVVATELYPGSYSLSNNRVSTLVHNRDGVPLAMLCFNESGAGFRDNVNNIFYNFYGEHNLDSLKPHIEQMIANYLSKNS